jgi:hypothetical protein
MKAQQGILFAALAIGLAGSPHAIAAGPGIPIPAGHFSFTAQGTEASCVVGQSCIVLGLIEAGNMFRDSAGNACGSHTAVVNTVPPTASAPTIVPSVMTVLKSIQYDPSTGTGDAALTEYAGGSCNGVTFNSAGAVQILSGTLHFTVSNGENGNGGNRIDSIITALEYPGVGGFSITFTERQQKSSGNQ